MTTQTDPCLAGGYENATAVRVVWEVGHVELARSVIVVVYDSVHYAIVDYRSSSCLIRSNRLLAAKTLPSHIAVLSEFATL